jgi:hypothetical protein
MPYPSHDSATSTAGFLTDVLQLANWLTARGHAPTLRPTGAGRFTFWFAPSDALTRDVETFNDGAATIEPTVYDAARVELRKRMDAIRGRGGR